jgi:DNA transformation protein
VDREGLEDLFAPFGPVAARRMFSGHGVYADGLCFALALRGEIYIKADAETEAEFAAAGSQPFIYNARGREVKVGFWRLVASAYDDEDELKRWSSLGLAAARRAAAVKAAKAAKRAKPKAVKRAPKATKPPGQARPAADPRAKRRPRG